jgi:ubiquitin-conjugating enzyme E2 variant
LNGDVAFLYALALAALWLMPLDGVLSEPLLISGFGLCAIGMWTNQIHQWAHLPAPPVAVRWLQDAGVLLGRSEHAAHHSGAFDRHYCITTGWWNRPLEAIGFFRRLEAVITAISGAHPREDDRRYAV